MEMSFFFIVITPIVALFVYFIQQYIKDKERRDLLKKLPGRPGVLFIGNIGWILKAYYFSKNAEYHPGVYILQRIIGTSVIYRKWGMQALWVGRLPIVGIFSPDMMEMVLSSSVSLEKSFEYSFLHKWLGLGLLTSTGSRWRSRRKILTPSFHFRILEDFLPTFHEQSMVLVKKLYTLTDNEYVDISPLIVLCTLDIVCDTMMGCHIGAQTGENSDYVQAIHNLADFFNRRSFSPWLWWDFLFSWSSIGRAFANDLNVLHSFTKKVIKEKKDSLLKQASEPESSTTGEKIQPLKRKALMDLLLDLHLKGEKISEEDIQEEVDTFMFEGHDTTAMAIIYALYTIGLYPEVQRKLHEEIESIFDNDSDRPITLDDVRNMKYLECTLKESQRLFPSVPLIGRKLNEDLHCSKSGLTIPNGTTVHCHIISLHRDPEYFPNPEVFDPDRFLPDNNLNRHPYCYVPFSAGPRNCIGQKFALLEEKVVVCNILRNFEIRSLDPRDKVHMKVEFTLRPANEIRLKFVPR